MATSGLAESMPKRRGGGGGMRRRVVGRVSGSKGKDWRSQKNQ